MLLILTNELTPPSPGLKTLNIQLVSEYIARIRNIGIRQVAIIFLMAIKRFIEASCVEFNAGSGNCFLL